MNRTATASGALGRQVAPFLELLGLSGLVVAQPLLASFSDSADIFVAVAAGPVDIVLFVLAVVLGPPVVLLLVEVLAGLVGPRVRAATHLGSLFFLIALLAIRVGKDLTDLGWKRLTALAVVAAAVLIAVIWRAAMARAFLRFLAAAPLALAVLFVAASPVTGLVLADDDVDVADVDVAEPAPVVFVVFDELPLVSLLDETDEVDAELFPNFASLARDSTWYRNTTTVSPQTRQAVPAILDGRYPEDPDTVPTAAEHPQNLFTLLGGTYDLNVSEAWTSLCPSSVCPDAARARGAPLGALFEEARTLWSRQASPKRSQGGLVTEAEIFGYRGRQFRDFRDSLDRPSDGPRLDFLHLLLPHQGFEYLPSGQRYSGPADFGLFLGDVFDDEAGTAFRQRHLLQLAYTDRLLGDVLDRLRADRRYDESLVVVTGDHGIGFSDDAPLRWLNEENLHEILWTPLFVKAPGQREAVVDDSAMRSIDILPTVAEELGLDLPEEVDGVAGGPPADADEDERRVQTWEYDELDGGEDGYIQVDGEEGFDDALDEEPAVDGDSGEDLALYRRGAFGDLVGEDLDGLHVGEVRRVEGGLHAEQAYEEVDPDDRRVPVWVSGWMQLDASEPLRVAVAVNGVIGGWSRVYLDEYLNPGLRPPRPDQTRQWGTLVPPELLWEGENEIELLFLGDDADDELRPVELDD